MRSSIVTLVLLFCLGIGAAPTQAQGSAPAGTLVVTVVDSTGAVLPGATVTVTGHRGGDKAAAIEPVKATDQGVATIQKLAPGRYSVRAEFSGFETRMLPDVRVRNGNNKQVLMLPVEGHKETVLVGQDKQAAAADPRGPSFGTTLTREQLANLSDDPEVLRQQLMDMAGPGAVIRVDSFEGAALPNKSQIRSIRISRDQFAAEFHAAGGINVEIITQPGMGPMRMNVNYRLLGDELGGRSPFVPERGPESNRNLGMGGGGTLIKNKSSFNFFINDVHGSQTPNINIVTPDGEHRSEAMAIQSHNDGFNGNLNVDYALTIDQTLRFGLSYNTFENRNQGIGQWDREERAYTRENHNGQFNVQQIGPLGRRAFLRTRMRYSWTDSASVATIEVPTVRVLDAFTVGGGQVAGGQRSKTLTLGSDFDYVRGNHTWRMGTQIDTANWHSDDHTNYLGTYTFESLAAYDAGRPRSYTRRVGDPNIDYTYFQGALYAQDDFRIRRNLTLSGGVRYEAQNHVDDFDNIMPRLGVTWAPGTAGHDDAAGELGHLHRLAAERHLRADAACRRRTPEGDRSRQSAVSDRLRSLVLDRRAGEPIRAGRRSRAAPLDARQPRRRSPLQAGPGERHLCLHPRRRRHSRREHERARQRRAARCALRQRDRGGLRRQQPAASAADQSHDQPGCAISAAQERAALQPQARDRVPELHARPEPQQQRRRVQCAGVRRSRS